MKDERAPERKQNTPRVARQGGEPKGGQRTASNESDDSVPIYLNSDTTLQTPEEHERDQRIDPRKSDKMDVSDSDLEEIKAGKLTGREPDADLNERE